MEPEKKTIPAKKKKEAFICVFPDSIFEFAMISIVKTWYIIYLTPVSKLCMASIDNFSFKECAPKAPVITVKSPKRAAIPEIFLIIIVRI